MLQHLRTRNGYALLCCLAGLSGAGDARSEDVVDGPAQTALRRYVAATVLWLWPAGATIEGCFLNGSADERRHVVEGGETWSRHANIHFDFGAVPDYRTCSPMASATPVRVSFGSGAISHAPLGTFALTRANDRPNMFIATSFPSKKPRPPEIIRSTVLHELGHVLGLKHEHQHPESACFHMVAWTELCAKREAAVRLPAFIVTNWLPMVGQANPDYVAGRPYDPLSIMHYKFPPKNFSGPAAACAGERNAVLSEGDKTKIALFYPKTRAAQVTMVASQSQLIAKAILSVAEFDQAAAERLAREGERLVRRTHPELANFSIDVSAGLAQLKPAAADRGTLALRGFGAGQVEAAVAACARAEPPPISGRSGQIRRTDR